MNATAMKGTSIQLAPDLLAELKMIATAEGRSLASQIRLFLADAVTRQNTANKKARKTHAA